MTLYDEPENFPWLFEGTTNNISFVINEEKLVLKEKRLTPQKFALYSAEALHERSTLPVFLQEKLVLAKHLLPTQSRLNGAKSLYDQITNNWNALDNVFNKQELSSVDGNFPILVFAEKYIVDGHHRWSQFMMSNPSATIKILNIPNLRPTTIIKTIQDNFKIFDVHLNFYLTCSGFSTLIEEETFLEEENYKNSFKVSLKETKEYINENITDYCVEVLFNNNQISNPNKQEAINFYIKNLQYFLRFKE